MKFHVEPKRIDLSNIESPKIKEEIKESRWELLNQYYRKLVSTARANSSGPNVPTMWLEADELVVCVGIHVFYVVWHFTDREYLPYKIGIIIPNDYLTMPLQELKELVDATLDEGWTDRRQAIQYWTDYCEVTELVMAAIEQAEGNV